MFSKTRRISTVALFYTTCELIFNQAVRDVRKARREGVLRGLADGRQQPGDANRELESLRWLNGAVYHAWRVADSLQQSMGE
jgi:hypothetical protein